VLAREGAAPAWKRRYGFHPLGARAANTREWRYSITCTNIPRTGIAGVPGSHHPQYIDVLHREHAVVETDGVRTALG
jgi:hypothetical protein